MSTPEWIKYDGSDKQISDIQTSEHGWMTEDFITIDGSAPIHDLISVGDKYLICQQHPCADLIKIWADTGCPVYAKHRATGQTVELYGYRVDWNYEEWEFSLTPFED